MEIAGSTAKCAVEIEHVRQFHGECAGRSGRGRARFGPVEVDVGPDEAIKGVGDAAAADVKAAGAASCCDFLNLDRRATITADRPRGLAAARRTRRGRGRCRATLAPNSTGRHAGDAPYGPKGRATGVVHILSTGA